MSPRQRLILVLWTAGAVSVGCNILAAEPTPVGRAVAAWPPIALLLVVEVLARSALPNGWLRWASMTGAAGVAAVAALASFHHMHEVALTAGESPLVAWLFPLTVDGVAVVASAALVGTGRHHDQGDGQLPAIQAPGVDDFEPAASGVVSVPQFVPLGARSPVLNGAGSNNNQESNHHA